MRFCIGYQCFCFYQFEFELELESEFELEEEFIDFYENVEMFDI